MKNIKASAEFMGMLTATFLVKSKNFEITRVCSLYHVEEDVYGYASIGDWETDTTSCKFRGDECNLVALRNRLHNEGMNDLVRELDNLERSVAEGTLRDATLKANKKALKTVLGVKKVKVMSTLPKAEQDVIKFKYYSKQENFDKLPKDINEEQFHKRWPNTRDYEDNADVTLTIEMVRDLLVTAKQINS